MNFSRGIMLIGSIALMQFSCGGNTAGERSAQVAKGSDSVHMVDPDAKGGNTCLLGYADKLDKLLTVDLAVGFTHLPANDVKVKYSKVMKNPFYHSISYSWKSDRTRSLKDAGIDMDVPVNNQVQLHGIRENSLTSFKSTYRVPTDEQLQQTAKAIDNALEGKSGNKQINERVEQLDKMKIDKNTQKSVAKGVEGVMAKVARAYQDVAGVGDAASWNSVEKRLYVLENGVEVSVSVDLSADDTANKEKAIDLLRKLLALCN